MRPLSSGGLRPAPTRVAPLLDRDEINEYASPRAAKGQPARPYRHRYVVKYGL